jgi:hypothetical protein
MRFLVYQDLSPGDLAEKVDKVRGFIERDDFRSADVKKLGVGSYYRAKLDDASRLLLQFVTYEGQKAALALEVIRQHAYDRSRFLRGAPVDESRLVAEEAPTVETRALRYLHPTRPSFHVLDKPLSFDDAQDVALRHRPPLVIVGSAGSGKTALLLQRLRSTAGHVAYVTESRWLAETSRSAYVAFDGAPADQEIDFLSYRQLLETVAIPAGRAVTFRDFAGFFERHRQKVRFADAHQVFEEFRGVLTSEPEGPFTREAYLALGVKQSMFDVDQRGLLFELYERYRAWLTETALYEPNLVAHAWLPRMEPTYDFVAVDEVQDLTNVQLALVLKSLKAPGHFVIAGDANQIVHPNYFAWSKVKSLFWRGLGEAKESDSQVLSVSYRNSIAVTDVANGVLKVKHARFGSIDRETNELMQAIAGEPGSVASFATSSSAVKDLDVRTRDSTKVAVVVLREEDKAEARKYFRTPLVFSVHEAKGLEYDAVVLFRIISSERRLFAELAEGLTREDLAVDTLAYRRARDKSDKSLELYKFYVNSLYVALTRSVKDAYLVEDDVAHPLLALLGVTSKESASSVQSTKATSEDWQKEAHRLELQGKQEQAEAIRSKVLQLKPVPWTVLDAAGVVELADKALAPGSVSKKAMRQLYEFACFHDETLIAQRLSIEAGFEHARTFDTKRTAEAKRFLDGYESKNIKEILRQTETYGINFRSPVGVTPLILATIAGNVPLVEALLERGASIRAQDHLGRAALHWSLRRAYADPLYATTVFGTIYDLVAPASFDVESDGRLHQIGREKAEFFFLSTLIARFSELYQYRFGRTSGLTADFFVGGHFETFPQVVIREERRKRTYVNHVLSRNEVNSKYTPARKLWLRERQGHYVPNPELRVRVDLADGNDVWKPLVEVLNIGWTESHLRADAARRLAPRRRTSAAP